MKFFNSNLFFNKEDSTIKDIKYSTKYKKEYNLTPYQREALIGIILGDGFLEREKPSFNTRLRIEQSYPEKEKYFYSLHQLLEPLVAMNPVILTIKPEKRTSKIYKSIYFRTLAFPC